MVRALLVRLAVLVASWLAIILLPGFDSGRLVAELFLVAIPTVALLILLDIRVDRSLQPSGTFRWGPKWLNRLIVYASAFTLVFVGYDVLRFIFTQGVTVRWSEFFVALGMLVAFTLATLAGRNHTP